MKKNKFAKTIFVHWEDGGGSDDYRVVGDTAQQFAETHVDVEVGEYRLVRVRKVKTRIEIE